MNTSTFKPLYPKRPHKQKKSAKNVPTHVTKIYFQTTEFNIKKTNNPTEKWMKDMNRQVRTQHEQMANKHMKIFLNLNKNQGKQVMRHFLSITLAKHSSDCLITSTDKNLGKWLFLFTAGGVN